MKKRLVYPVLLIALMIFIFCMSAQPADDSTVTSSRFCTLAARLLISGFDAFSQQMQIQIVDGLAFVVRKAAHFSEYGLMGFLWYLWLRDRRGGMPIALGAAALYAVTDEIHQYFVPGRSCELRDVLVDTSGALTGILAAFVLLSVIWCLRHQDAQQRGIWHM